MKRFRMALLLALSALAPGATPAATQRVTPVTIGEQVRLETTQREMMLGVLERFGDDSIDILVEGDQDARTVLIESLARLQTHRGTKRAIRRGAVVGAVAGGVLGIVAYYNIATMEDGDCSRGLCAIGVAGLGGLIFGVVGAVPGALIGSLLRVDVWEDVPLPARPTPSRSRVP